MCEPVTVGAAVLAAGSGIYKGVAANAAAKQQAGIAEQNAVQADYGAADATARGGQAEAKTRMQGAAIEAHQRSQYGASGIDVNAGSAVDVVSSTAMLTELEAQIMRNNAAREAWGFKVQAGNFRRQAQLDRDAGQAQETGSILSGIAGAASYAAPEIRVGRGGK